MAKNQTCTRKSLKKTTTYKKTCMVCLFLSLPNNVWRLIVFVPFLLLIIIIIIIIIITSPRLLSGDVLLFYVSFSLLLLLLLLLFFHTFLSALFLGDAWIELYETL
jgi:hypothetical protein